jgi:hypothetical protein
MHDGLHLFLVLYPLADITHDGRKTDDLPS